MLARPEQRAVDQLHHTAQNERADQSRNEVETVYYRAKARIPDLCGKTTEQCPSRDEDPVVIGRRDVVAKKHVLRGGGERSRSCQ